MNSYEDCTSLQNDINDLNHWCNANQTKFHPDKCKVISINANICNSSNSVLTYLSLLPLSRFNYILGNNVLDYVTSEKDLGVIVSNKFISNEQHNQVINKASQMLGLTKRTCHFVVIAVAKITASKCYPRTLW